MPRQHTDATKAAIAAALRGRKRPPEVIAKISAALRGRKLAPYSEARCRAISEGQRGKVIAESTKAIWSRNRKGRKPSAETRALLSQMRKGQTKTPEWIARVAAAHRGKPKPSIRGENHYNWKGGAARKRDGDSADLRLWAAAVRRRDNYTCQSCGHCSKRALHAHHVLSYAEYPDHRFDIDNGITLCATCHKAVHLSTTVFSVQPMKPNTVEIGSSVVLRESDVALALRPASGPRGKLVSVGMTQTAAFDQ